MMKLNETPEIQVTEFIFIGITDRPELQGPLFGVFFLNYIAIALGNLGLIILTSVDSHLQTPMYFFLRHLAYVDLGYSTAIGPKMLVSFIEEKNIISYKGCVIQIFTIGILITCEFFILSAMAYDRYVAICKPLLYMVIMSDRVCWVLLAISYLHSIMVSLLITINIFNLSFCESNIIRHFYCDSLPLLSIVCSDTSETELIIMILSAFNLISSLLIILASYMIILVTILRINSAEGRQKAFSTCASHLTVVTVFYGTLLFMYLQPQSSHSFDTDKIASVFYTLVMPMLNPLIYSLRNKEVKGALKRTQIKLYLIVS
ncbi:olfactory receptor 8K3-like [Dromiciops gliroides]|uniref:olfactory receptor 8K3-like n=1 Tax=Dromiciops gliroides TaxID=33562 RepID=UPI001CC775F0|nr:olfactory receptor 8K3-like [Dromiciops gliroides]